MTTDLVPADNMAAVEALDPAAREIAVTRMLSEARSWLAHAVEATQPQSIADFKAQMATVAEATEQLGLSKDIQLDALEMVRRAERGVGLAIIKGQAEGTVNRPGGDGRPRHDAEKPDAHGIRFSPRELLVPGRQTVDVYAMANASDDQFEEAIAEAKEEGDASRSNVVRKIRGGATLAEAREARLQQIKNLAKRGYSSRQMSAWVGVSDKRIREVAREFEIEIPADKVMGRSQRFDHTQMVGSTVDALDNLVSALNLIDFGEVDTSEASQWATSLSTSITALKRFQSKIKEMTHG